MSRAGTTRKLILALIAASPLLAQAWLLPKGEGAVALTYQNNYLPDHVFSKGERHDVGPIHLQGMLTDVDYSLSDKLALRIGLPYFAGKYEGPVPHQLPIDDGTYHGTLQDFHIDARYNIRRRPVVLTPFVRGVIPSHAYEHYAHSTIGRRLPELHVGVNVGRRLDFISSNAFLQARYAYVLGKRTEGIVPRRSDIEFQMGYFLTPRWSVMALGSWTHPHNGIDYILGLFPDNLTPGQLLNHDRIARLSSVDLGGGVSFAASKSMDLFASAVTSVRSRNGHALASAVTVGVSWHFRTAWAGIPETPSPALPGSGR